MKLFINPTLAQINLATGIGQVVNAQYKGLPGLGYELVDSPEKADLIASHVTGDGLPRVDVLHCHGLYWTGDPGGQYSAWHHTVNQRIAIAARQALRITVPSAWVAMPFKRDMRISPAVIGHGVNYKDWQVIKAKSRFYILWNKNRPGDVCDPGPVMALAEKGLPVYSTFAPEGFTSPYLKTLGQMPFEEMKTVIEHSSIYLATTQETFGIGTLEALAAGVPVLGYRWRGTEEIITHLHDGYLVEPGDTEGLIAGAAYIIRNYEKMSYQARKTASLYTWEKALRQYDLVYQEAYKAKQAEGNQAVSVIITSYNYGAYVTQALESAKAQMRPGDEIIVIDDGSTDNTKAVLEPYRGFENITILHTENQGVAGARNLGIRMAKNPLYICLDADDQLGAGFVASASEKLSKNRAAGVAYCGLKFLQGSQIVHTWNPAPFDWAFQTRVPERHDTPPPTLVPTPSACMFKKELWERAGGYKQEYAPGEDTEFVTRALSLGWETIPIAEEGIHTIYRVHGAGQSRVKKYVPITPYNPWLMDKQYPFAAPSQKPVNVRSYADPFVSVIIPVGPGHEGYLPTCLETIIGQTFREWEVIIIDDTRQEGIGRYLTRYPFVKVVKAPRQGVGAARNAGIEAARGEWLYFLDVDDLATPEALESLLAGLGTNQEGACYAYSDYLELAPDGTQKELKTFDNPKDNRSRWFDAVILHPVTVLINRQALIEKGIRFDEEMPGYEDWEFFTHCNTLGICGKKVEGVTALIRVGTGHFKDIPLRDRNALKNRVKSRYKDYMTGAKSMADCGCGAGGEAILNVKKRMIGNNEPIINQPLNLSTGVTKMEMVRMEFTGAQMGAVTYPGNAGRTYRASANSLHKFHNVHPEDVQKLLDSGNFKLVDRPIPQAPTGLPVAPVAPPAPVVIPHFDPVSLDDPEPQLEALFADKVEPLPVAPPAPAPEGSIPVDTRPPAPSSIPSIAEKTVAEIAVMAETAGKGYLLDWLQEEKEGKNRKSAITALETALNKLMA